MWFATSDGLNRYDSQNILSFYHSEEDSNSLDNNEVWSVYPTESKLWVGTSTGLNWISYNDIQVHRTEIRGRITTIKQYNGDIYYRSRGEIFKVTNQKSERVENPDSNLMECFGQDKRLCTDKTFEWRGTDTGLIRTTISSGREELFVHEPFRLTSLVGDEIRVVTRSNDGVIWIGTWGAGISFYDPQMHRFGQFKHHPFKANSLSHDFVQCIHRSKNGKLWVGGKKGLNIQSVGEDGFHQLDLKNEWGSTINQKYVTAIIENRLSGNLWVSTESEVIVIHPESEQLVEVVYQGVANGSLKGIVCLFQDSNNDVWAGTWRGLLKFDPVGNRFIEVGGGTEDLSILDIVADSKGDLWLGTYRDGLVRFDVRQEIYTKVDEDDLGKKFPHKRVWTVSVDSAGNVWTGTFGAGLVKVSRTNGVLTFERFTRKNGLGSDVVIAMEPGKNNDWWIAGDYGLTHFIPEKSSFEVIDSEYGLQSNHFNAASYSDSGLFYFGGSNGLTCFQSDQLVKNNFKAPVQLLDLRLFDQEVVPSENGFDLEIADLKELELRHDQNSFSLDFIGLCFNISSRTRYRFKLEGFDQDWHLATANRNTATYTSLPYGNYNFVVQAANHDGVWGAPRNLMIHIATPFWASWWFVALCSLFAAAILYGIYRFRIEQVRKVERLRTKIASDLHDDVGSLLTQISMQSDLITQGVLAQTEQELEIKKIASTSREAVKTMGDVVWSIDARKGTVADMLDRMKDYSSEMLQSKEIDFEFEVSGWEPTDIVDLTVRQNLYLIYKEAINNVVKHSNATSILVEMNRAGKDSELIVQDNGSSVSSGKKVNGQGLMNMQMRAERLGGTLTVDKSNGYRIHLKF